MGTISRTALTIMNQWLEQDDEMTLQKFHITKDAMCSDVECGVKMTFHTASVFGLTVPSTG